MIAALLHLCVRQLLQLVGMILLEAVLASFDDDQ